MTKGAGGNWTEDYHDDNPVVFAYRVSREAGLPRRHSESWWRDMAESAKRGPRLVDVSESEAEGMTLHQLLTDMFPNASVNESGELSIGGEGA